MRLIFMGSPDFAVTILDAVAAEHEVVAAYCQPPRRAGRGKGERPTPVELRARELGIEVRSPRTLRSDEEQQRFRELEADVAVVAAYGLILPRPVLEAPRLGCINVHASLLPRWRGAAPIQRAILAGDETGGVTIMQMDEGLDTGPMLLTRKLTIAGKNAGQVTEEMAKSGAEALLEWLRAPTPPVPQPEVGATYAAKIDKTEARIDWTRPAEEVERQVRAFAPSPGAWFEARGERVKLLEAVASSDGGSRPGEVLDDCLNVACGTGCLQPLKVQRAGRAPMTPGELLRGFLIARGTVLE